MKYANAAMEYLRGVKIRAQARELSTKKLAEKFDTNEKVIQGIERGRFQGSVTEEDRQLILACIKERRRLEAVGKSYYAGSVCSRHHISRRKLQEYVEDFRELADG